MKQGASEDKVMLETKLMKMDNLQKKIFELQKRYFELPQEADLIETDEAIEKMEEMEKLDKETRKQFEITLKSKEVPDLDNFLTFLENRSLVSENVNKNVPSKSFSKDQSYHKGFSSSDEQKTKYHQYAKPNKSFVVGREDKMK
ncbi:hypothetical protein AVEN_154058-1 [Araneus ventricosus]|uniref:Uncharacterized protein n=1 Tax=Araneus ventricosus TaxID=182803 RepID=A0A4Y2SIW1_ARAVE|nr:hypothetical protein AVEN_154058-1 [Araneus ventricosus]